MPRCISLAFAGLVGLILVPPAQADQKAADEALKARGLRRAGALYVLPAEAEVAKAVKSAQTLRREVAAATQQGKLATKGAEANKRMVVELTQQRMMLRRQLPMAANVAQHNEIVDALNELGDRINLLQQGGVDPKAIREVEAAAARRREAFLQAVLDARNLVKEAEARYGELADDGEVTAALAELNQGRKEKVALGPGRAFKADVKALEALEASIQSESLTLREDRGTFLVDVVLNGKLTKSMVFDTGASLISLPADYADELGIKRTDDLPDVRVQVADGSVKVGKLVRLATVRVGKFVAEDVECVVMPDTARAGVPPLLGGSFLKHFSYKLDPATGVLTLARIEAAPGVKAGATTKSQASRPNGARLPAPAGASIR